MLGFNSAWRFDSPGPIPAPVTEDLRQLINRTATQGDRKFHLELFKRHFSTAAGLDYRRSSSTQYAETDLAQAMEAIAHNAPLFIEAFYNACEELREAAAAAPSVARVNAILARHQAGYRIEPPHLITTGPHYDLPAPVREPSLDDRVWEIIERSFQRTNALLAQGEGRAAVQEIAWLLESVSTVFRNMEAGERKIAGDYFNTIIKDLRRASQRGGTVDTILGSMLRLHDHLSNPQGGGIRHGMDLKEGVAIDVNEARFYSNQIRSFVHYLLGEHHRLAKVKAG